MEAFQSALRDLGYVVGKNIFIEPRWAEEHYDQLPALAEELVRLRVDILLTYGTPGTLAAKRATTDIPILFLYIGDAVSTGAVSSLSRPGANVTGNTYFLPELMAKRLELLKDAVPHLSRAAVLVKPDNPLFKSTPAAIQSAANSLKVDLQQFDARSPNEFEAAFSTMTRNRVEAIVLQEDAVFLGNLKQIIAPHMSAFGGKADMTIQSGHAEMNTSCGGYARRFLLLPVTLLIRADELRIGQYVAPHGSLDLRFCRAP
jgi:putative ABC transport system substrate-binding protein